MDRSTKTDEFIKNKNFLDNNCERKTLKIAATKTETNSEEVDDYKSVLSDLTFTFGAAPDRVQNKIMIPYRSHTGIITFPQCSPNSAPALNKILS